MMLWVFKRDAAINNAQGFVDVPDVLADRLIQEGKAAAQYDQLLELEPEQPGDGEEPTGRAERAAARARHTTPPPEPDAPQEAAQEAPQAVPGDDDATPRRRFVRKG